ncbi:hypothetical protein WJX81_007911 [Elliptochloris bilobata]|uniref:Thiamine pyrimidine synthase n=1 Tax=Elliptochloris bilobata TaxID=381761 RepID=A0AAW1RSA0_9CHLO
MYVLALMITLALEWLPNTNHTCFFVAQAHGWYEEAGIKVSFLSPHADEYRTTPASKLRSGAATLAIAPTETATSSHRPRNT